MAITAARLVKHLFLFRKDPETLTKLLILLFLLNVAFFVYDASEHGTLYRLFWQFGNQDDEGELLFESPAAECSERDSVQLARLKNCSNVLRPNNVVDPTLIDNNKNRFVDFSRVVLIVSLNTPTLDAVSKVQRLYRNLFQKIIFCITGIGQLQTFAGGKYADRVNVSFVEYAPVASVPAGETIYACIPVILDSIPEVRQFLTRNKTDGFLHISDDFIVNLWRFERGEVSLNRNWLMFPPVAIYDMDTKMKCRGHSWNNTADCTEPENWPILSFYRNQASNAMVEVMQMYPRFIFDLSMTTGGERRMWNTYADMFYITKEYVDAAADLFRIFARHRVFVELVVGTVIRGITPPSKIQLIQRVGQISGPVRMLPVTDTYSVTNYIYHPLKMGAIENSTIDRQCLYCSLVAAFDKLRSR